MFDIPGQIRKAVGELLLWVAQTGLRPVLDAMGSTVLSTPDLVGHPQVKAMWTTSLVLANAVFVLFVIASGFTLASRETLQTQYGLKELAPRLVVGVVAANTSHLICGKALEATNALTQAIAGQGVDGPAAAQAIAGMLTGPLTAGNPSILLILLVIAVVVMTAAVIMTFILRVAVLVLLVGVAPLALVCHATPQTEALAYTWWRALVACLGLQIGQAIIILATVRVFLTPTGPSILGIPATDDGLLAVLVCLVMLWLLVKLPGLMRHLVLAAHGRRGHAFGQVLRTILIVRALHRRTRRTRPQQRSRQRRPRPPQPHGRGRRPPQPHGRGPRPHGRGPQPHGRGPRPHGRGQRPPTP